MALSIGDAVRFKDARGQPGRGLITQKSGKTVRVVDDQGRQYTTSPTGRGVKIRFKSVKPVWAGVFLFDTQLTPGFRSQRRGEVFWREYCRHAEWTFGYERVHSLNDLSYFLEKRTIKEHILIFNGHGSGRSGWQLSNGQCLNGESDLAVSAANRGKVVIFSACNIGANRGLCVALREKLGASDVVAYRARINDDMAFIAEPMLIHLLNAEYKPGKVAHLVERVATALDPWKTLNLEGAKSFPLVGY
jgi:hypothetical protein